MKYRQVTERVGELLGPVDWSYDFEAHCWGPDKGGTNPSVVESRKQILRRICDEPDAEWEVGLCHSDCMYKLLAVGMYDGWPYWKPTPSVCTANWLGVEWHCWTFLRAARKVASATPSPASESE